MGCHVQWGGVAYFKEGAHLISGGGGLFYGGGTSDQWGVACFKGGCVSMGAGEFRLRLCQNDSNVDSRRPHCSAEAARPKTRL